MKVGVIGVGGVVPSAHIPSYLKIKDVELVGIADTNDKIAKIVSQKCRCEYYSDFKQLIDKNELDAISICTPPLIRNDIIQYAAENNINILCETPLSSSYSNALGIKKIIEKSGVQLMMCFVLRFFDWYQNAFELIRDGRLGEVVFSRCVYASELPPYSWVFDKGNTGGGVIVDRGSHVIDLVTWLLSTPKKVEATILNKRNMGVAENAFITLTHENSVSQLALSFGVNVHFNRPVDRIEIYGTACNLIMDHSLDICSFLPASEHILKKYMAEVPKNAIKYFLKHKNLVKQEDPHFKAINYFVNCLKNGDAVSPNYLDGLTNIKIIDACYKSMKEERVIQLNET